MWYSARASGPVTTLKMRSWRIMLTPYTVPVICSVLGVTDCNEGGRPRQPVKERPPKKTRTLVAAGAVQTLSGRPVVTAA